MAQNIIDTKIREAYDTEANWIKYNPVLLAGQLAFSKDKYGKYKIGDGIAKWSQLQYMTLGWNDITGKPSTFPPSTHNHPASQITGLPTKLPNPYALTVKGNGALLNTYDGSGAKEINITPAVIGAATSGHTHSQYASTSHNHSADNITSGVLPIGRGGTGGTNLTTTANSLKYYCLQGKTGIPENADLNTYRTAGVFLCPQDTRAKTIKNSPTNGSSFSLEVDFVLDSSNYIRQTVRQYNNYRTFIRYQLNGGDWTSWQYIVMGNDIIPVTSGGTGANTYSTALKNLVINGAVSGSAVPTDTNWYLCSDNTDNNGIPVKRTMSSLWSYIKGKTDANYLKLSGTAVSASSIKVSDTRDDNPMPNNSGFKKSSVTFDFKSSLKIGSPTGNTYVGLMSFAPWSNTSGGNGYQMAFGYLNATTPKLMIRTADLEATTWGAWHKIYTSGDKPTPAEIGAATSGHTHNYAGSSSAGGAANSANMLNANAGSSTQPVYFSGGKPVACAYTLGKSVPSNAVFTDTNTWRPVQNNLTSTSTSDALSAYQGKVLKDLIDGKASSNHSHSYLPLSGGTLSGRLTANGRIYATSIGGSWISGMTPTNATLGISTQNLNGSYHPIIACKTYNSHVWNLGTITDTVGFYGFKKGRTDNGTDWSFAINVTNGAVSSTGGITAPSFTGYLNGNAKTATNVAWSGIIGRPSTFTPSSHTHNTINDFKSGTGISISTSTIVTPEKAGDYDVVVANTSTFGDYRLVTMSKVNFGNQIIDTTLSRITIDAIDIVQIDSLAKL